MDERTRYINIRFISPILLDEKDAWFIVSSEVRRLFGTEGASNVGLFLSFFDQANQGGIYRSSHKYMHLVRSALCFIHSRKDVPLFLFTENVSGTLKKAKTLLAGVNYLTIYQELRHMLCKSWEHHLNDD
ncbi:MAG: Rpp14/Pop5 family protein [Candidatus Hodarchaeales archaeon]|jgi:RNase P/RNase MRP subunit POP5